MDVTKSLLNCGACGNKCALGETCSGGLCKKALGRVCASGSECTSGFCEDKVCCNRSCGGSCRACDTAGSVGICKNHAAGADPEKGCGAYTCNGLNACYSGCLKGTSCGAPYCKASAWCYQNKCLGRFSAGHACVYPCSCTSGACKLLKCQ